VLSKFCHFKIIFDSSSISLASNFICLFCCEHDVKAVKEFLRLIGIDIDFCASIKQEMSKPNRIVPKIQVFLFNS
jgi:hypothetical protein